MGAPAGRSGTHLAGAAADVAGAGLGVPAAAVARFEAAVEDHLTRVDEVSLLADSCRIQVANSADTAYPQLLKASAELQALFAVIEQAEVAVGAAYAATKATADRLEAVQRGYDSKYPEGLSKITSWLGGARKAPLDAPVLLPPWDAAAGVFLAAPHIAALRHHVGTLDAPAAPASSIAAAPPHAAADDAGARRASSPSAAAAAAAAAATATAAAGGGDVAASPVEGGGSGVGAAGRGAAVAVGEGEDDEEDDEEDEEGSDA